MQGNPEINPEVDMLKILVFNCTADRTPESLLPFLMVFFFVVFFLLRRFDFFDLYKFFYRNVDSIMRFFLRTKFIRKETQNQVIKLEIK